VPCAYCEATIATAEGSSTVQGVVCLKCLAAWPELPFAQVLLSLRMAAEVSQKELARQTGLSLATISDLERAKHVPRSKTRKRLLSWLQSILQKRR
jgi:DNA-binding transcriptional regulator YiaG